VLELLALLEVIRNIEAIETISTIVNIKSAKSALTLYYAKKMEKIMETFLDEVNGLSHKVGRGANATSPVQRVLLHDQTSHWKLVY
jgi:hypothetical protein